MWFQRRSFALFLVTLSLIACEPASNKKPGTDVAVGNSSGAPLAEYPMLPLDLLMAPESYTAPKISPDGKRISWIAPLDGIPNFYVAEVDDLDGARPVTRFTDNGVRATDVSGQVMYRWHFDSRHIIYPKDYNGDENWDIHIVNVEHAENRNLTPLPDKSVEIIAYGRANPNQALVSVQTFGTLTPDVYRLDLLTGEYSLVQENDGSLAFLADNDLNIRLSVSFTAEGGLDIFKYAPEGRGEKLYEVSLEDMPAIRNASAQDMVRFSADNEKLYVYDAALRDKAALVALDVETGDITVLAEDDRVDIGGVLYQPVDGTVQAYAVNWTRNRWVPTDESIAVDFRALDTIEEGDWSITSRSDADDTWVVRYMAAHKPVSFYLYERATKTGTRMFTATPQLEGLKLSDMHPYVLTTEDGLDLVSYITLPPWTDPDDDGRPDKPVPVVVYVHGGPSDERAIYAFGPIVHWLANRGYAFQYVNFRGSPGFGKAYMNAQNMEWGGKMHQDILDQVQWAIDEGIADPDKVAILGGSYGGYAALVGMTMTPDVFACGVDIVGPSDLEIFMPHWDEDIMGKTIGDPRTEEGRAFLRSRSPVNFAHQTKNPVLIGQGANDSRVPTEQSERIVEKMVEAGAEVTYVLFPDEGHGFVKPVNSMAFFAVMEVFYSQCLGGRSEAITDQIEGSSMQVPVGVEHIPGLAEALAARTDTGVAEVTVVEVDPSLLQRYAGKYLLEAYDVVIEVRWDDDKLLFEMPGQPVAELLPSSETEFFIEIAPTTFSFHLDDDGVSHMTIHSDGSETRVDRMD